MDFVFIFKFSKLFLLGIMNSLILVTQLEAIKIAPVSYMFSIKSTSIFISVIFGFLVFKEKIFVIYFGNVNNECWDDINIFRTKTVLIFRYNYTFVFTSHFFDSLPY